MRAFQKMAFLRSPQGGGGTPGGGGGGPIAHDTATSAGPTTESAGSFTGLVTLAFDFEASTDYLCLFSTEAQQSATSGTTSVQLLVDGVDQHSTDLVNDVRAATEYQAGCGAVIIQNGTAGTKNVVLQGRRNTTGTASFRNSKITIFKLGADDEFAEDLAGDTLTDTTANKTATTVASLSFTPPSAGDYLYIAAFLPRIDSTTNVYFGFELTDGTNTTGEVGMRWEGGSQQPTIALLHATSLSGAQQLDLKIRQIGTGATTIGCYQIRLIALRLDRFANHHITTLGSTSSSTTTSYVDALTQSFTPEAEDHLTLASWFQDATSSNLSYGQLLDDGATEGEIIRQYFFQPSGQGFAPGFAQNLDAYAATSRTQAIQRKSSSGGCRIRNASVIACLEMNEA